MKKIAIGLGALVVLLLCAIIVIPLAVDVDHYRPQIVAKANENLNGRLELGKLKLSLWGRIKVEIAGLSLKDAQGASILSVQDAYFHIPFLSVLSGSPSIELRLSKPELAIVKSKTGKLNVMTLPKGVLATETNPATPSDSKIVLPAIVVRSRLGFEMRDARLVYKDAQTDLSTELSNLNLVIRDISISRPSSIEFWTDFSGKMGKTFELSGPARLTAQVSPRLSGPNFQDATVTGKLDLDQLEIRAPGVFVKPKGMATHGDLKLVVTPDSARLERLNVAFHNAVVDVTGKMTGFENPKIDLSVKSNSIDLKPWNQLIPALKEYELQGQANLSASAEGPADQLTYQAKIGVNGLTAQSAMLKAQPRLDASIEIKTDQIESLLVTMKAPGNDLKLSGKLVSFTMPRGDFNLSSTGLDLDQLIKMPERSAAAAAAAAGTTAGTSSGAGSKTGAAAANYDAMLAPLRESPWMSKLALTLGINVASLKAQGVRLDGVSGNLFFKNLTTGVDALSMKVFGGVVKLTATADLAPKTPTYRFQSQLSGINLADAVASQFQSFRNTVVGNATIQMSGEGSSFNPEPMKSNLKANGSLSIKDAKFATIDVTKMLIEGINRSLDKVSEKVPPLKGRTLNMPASKESRYESITSDFTIIGGEFSAPNFVAKAVVNQGVDLRGETKLNLKDYALRTRWELIDTYNLSKAKDLSANIAGTEIKEILAEKGKPVSFPVTVTGTALAPQYGYSEIPGHLAKIALANTTGAATERAKSEAKKKVGDAIQKSVPNAPPALQKVLKGIFGG